MDKITQEAYFRQRVLKYAAEHGVTASANRYRLSRKTVHKWKGRYDGTLGSLKDRPRTNRIIRRGNRRQKRKNWCSDMRASIGATYCWDMKKPAHEDTEEATDASQANWQGDL